ncbi:PucR family transcriptional regulator [Mycobacterium sp. CBMA293]|uniref:PucR family transcriptional regulator n=2 Tax=Mycolicibacterium TaxID=1866885 RepID=UPI0012DF9C29|nr:MULTISPECIES: helix-turn-helix domain-containing protein [unclassified Mycolicibacterium]MUL49843.1 PucR family transcriptional regulator [Mycolicibacterium sp. CBMA 360]MUL61523.1 PucR family transcriptional regulator [Mycolicibacterium sp. CBMA 335]MUL74258.1 PucR family transcriptional regulator [Mycolicibacterium sp. CBMA 311]MUL97116.1 PucR family transcriptional regulator [Mycolicibacterium sp. CBMA 230]MUM04306.1 PucR family transcriptional regulator [Mycolicibacterium sp. CBMA 213]
MPRSHDTGALPAETAAMIMDRLSAKLPAMTRSLQELLFQERSAMGGDGELMTLLYDAVQGNLEAFFPAIRHGIPIDRIEAPTAALEHARRMAQRGTSVDEMVRAYRLGHQGVLKMILDEVRAAELETQLGLLVFEEIAASSFEYIDRVSHQVMTAYQAERDRWLANQNQMRALRVREVLDGGELDVDETTDLIRYPLHRVHLALTVWCAEQAAGDELDAMERFITELAAALGARDRPLFVASDRTTAWAWIPLDAATSVDAIALTRQFVGSRAAAPWLTAGNPLTGLAGFRQSHSQAIVARTVAMATGAPPQPVTAANEPGLVVAAQFSSDLDHARSWVSQVLGPLATDTDSDERLRETLSGFLRNSSSFKASADELHLHVNSVKYRVQRAVERRGRPIEEDRIDVEVALLLCHWFGATVLET